MKTKITLILLISIQFLSCTAQKKTPGEGEELLPIAFPGAEGFGKYTTGGRGGRVIAVTNLNDEGEGSFRKAATAKGPRIIIFKISGIIHLNTPLNIKGDVTIAGQSAPGDGICIADQPVSLNGNNIIIRYMRFRMGDRYQNKGMVPGSGHDDALNGYRRNRVIIDHCSISWSTDECFSVYGGDSTTLQWNIISEPLNYSYHFEEGDKDFENHGFGGIWGGKHLTAHHNLFAHCNSRNPRFDGIRNTTSELVDYRNNVIYNWGSNNVYAGEGGNYNIINNFYKYGPSTNINTRFRIVNPNKRDPDLPFGKFFVYGNYVDEHEAMTRNNELGVVMGNKGTEEDKKASLVEKPFPAVRVADISALTSYQEVLNFAGASFRRDTLDERIVNDVKNRTGRMIDVQGGFPHGTDYALTVNAWPALKQGTSSPDTDADGMPDDWEKEKGLDPLAMDDSKNDLHNYFTNIEVYLNGLIEKR